MRTAKWAQQACKGRRSPKTTQVDQDVWDSTVKEASPEVGWLIGPLSSEEVSARLGSLWVPCRRFGIMQGLKARNIDDCSEFLTNACFHAEEKVALGGLDEVVSIARTWIGAVQSDGSVLLPGAGPPSGTRDWLHPEWSAASATCLVGRTADLKHACKQVAPRLSH